MKLFKKKEKELEKEIDLKAMEEDAASKRTLTGGWEKSIFFFALAMALFHIYALVLSSTMAWYLYCVHVDAGAVMTFALYRGTKKSPINRPSAPDVVLMVLIAAAFTYMCVEMNTLIYRIGVNPNTMDLVVAVVVIVCVLEITRRTCVNILPIIALLPAGYGRSVPDLSGYVYGSDRPGPVRRCSCADYPA